MFYCQKKNSCKFSLSFNALVFFVIWVVFFVTKIPAAYSVGSVKRSSQIRNLANSRHFSRAADSDPNPTHWEKLDLVYPCL